MWRDNSEKEIIVVLGRLETVQMTEGKSKQEDQKILYFAFMILYALNGVMFDKDNGVISK